VEGRNFGIRKNVLQFDDVMNRQRELIYSQRAMVLDGEDMSGYIQKMIDEVVDALTDEYLVEAEDASDWNIAGLRDHFLGWITREGDLTYSAEQLTLLEPAAVKEELRELAHRRYAEKEKGFAPDFMREMERVILLRNVDAKWMDHIDAMSELKQGIYLRGYGQRDPVVEYRLEGFQMFDDMVAAIREDTLKFLYTFRVKSPGDAPKREQVATPLRASHGEGDGSVKRQPVRKEKIGRNEPCPCGSGKKYKKCCGQ